MERVYMLYLNIGPLIVFRITKVILKKNFPIRVIIGQSQNLNIFFQHKNILVRRAFFCKISRIYHVDSMDNIKERHIHTSN